MASLSVTRSDIEFIDVIDVDRHHGGIETAVGTRVARTVMLWLAASFAIQQRAVGDRNHTGRSVDREPTAGVVVQRVGDRVVGGVGVARQGRHADHRAIGGVFVNRVGRARRCR